MNKGENLWLYSLLLMPFAAAGVRRLARAIGRRLPEGRCKRLLTREFGAE